MAKIDYAKKYLGDDPEDEAASVPVQVDYATKYLGPDLGDEEHALGISDTAPVDKKPYSFSEHIRAGEERGLQDVRDSLIKGGVWAANKLGATNNGALPLVMNKLDQNKQAYEQQYGNDAWADAGQFMGQTAAALPAMAMGEGAVAATGIPAATDALLGGSALYRGGVFLGGNAARGAAGNALVGANPIEGAEYGAGLAPVQKLITKGGQKLVSKAADLLSSDEDVAGRKVMSALRDDGIDIETARNKLAEMGPHATIADIGGANVKSLADAAANRPGPASENIAKFLNERHSGQSDRILDATTSGLKIGPNVNYNGAIDDLITNRKTAAAPLYDKAFSAGPIYNDRVSEFLKEPIIQQGLNKGLKIQRLESLADGKPFNPSDYAITDFNEAGDPILGKVPNMRLLDAGKRGLDAIIQENTNQFGKVNELGRAVTKLKNAYLKELDGINPDYKSARAAYSEPSQSLDAIESGKNFIKNGDYGNAKELAAMSPDDKNFFRIGVGKAISDMLDNTPENADAAKRLISKPKFQKALRSVFPSNEAYEKFENTIRNEVKFYETKQHIMGNSATARRLAGARDAAEPIVDVHDLMSVAKQNYGHAAMRVGGKLQNRLSMMTPERAEAVGNLTVTRNPERALTELPLPRNPSPLRDFLGSALQKYSIPAETIGINMLQQNNPQQSQ